MNRETKFQELAGMIQIETKRFFSLDDKIDSSSRFDDSRPVSRLGLDSNSLQFEPTEDLMRIDFEHE